MSLCLGTLGDLDGQQNSSFTNFSLRLRSPENKPAL